MTWSNWSGAQNCTPRQELHPASEAEIVEIVRRGDGPIRVAGTGHSFTDIVLTDGVLLHLDRMAALARVEGDVAHVEAGMTLHELGPLLARHGLGLENQGDIDAQTVAGALATATHGTGARFGNLSTCVAGMRLVTAGGDVVEVTGGDDLLAARVSIGALGI